MKRYDLSCDNKMIEGDYPGEWVRYDDAQMIINQLTDAITKMKFNIENAKTALAGKNKIINKFWRNQ